MKKSYFDDILKNDSVELYANQLNKFNQVFADHMAEKQDFSLKLEIKADKGELIHCRVDLISFHRPNGKGEIKN